MNTDEPNLHVMSQHPLHKFFRFIRSRGYDTYLYVAFLLTLVAISGLFNRGFMSGGDIWPIYIISDSAIIDQSLSLWSTLISGLGSPYFTPVTLVWALFSKFWSTFGVPATFIQFLFLLSLLLIQGLGIAFFVRTLFPESKFLALVVALAVPISLYNALTFYNPIGAFSIGYLPWYAALVIRLLRAPQRQLVAGMKLGIGSLGLWVVSGTPPMAIFFTLWVALWVLVCWIRYRTWKQTYVALIIAFLFAVATNLWWAYAAYITLYGSSDTVEQTFVGPLGWAFVHGRASIINLLTMQGYWSWPMVEYFPWARHYSSGFLYYSMYFPLIFAVVGAFLTPYRRRRNLLIGILLVSLFICKGTHAPFGFVNEWMYQYLPFYWVFRDPQVEFAIILNLSLFTLAGLGLLEIESLVREQLSKRKGLSETARFRLRSTTKLVLAIILMTNGYAFVNGDTLNPNLHGTVKPIVNIPQYWYDAAEFMNSKTSATANSHSEKENSRVLLLPNNDFYQMHYRWGFYGVDEVAQSLFEATTVRLEPKTVGYLAGSKPYRENLQYIQDHMFAKSDIDISPSLKTMNIGWIVHRRDVVIAPSRKIMTPDHVASYLASQPNIKKEATFGELDIYKVVPKSSLVEQYDGVGYWQGSDLPLESETYGLSSAYVPWATTKLDATSSSAVYSPSTADFPTTFEFPADGTLKIHPRTLEVYLTPTKSNQLTLKFRGTRYENDGRTFGYETSKILTTPASWSQREAIALSIDNEKYLIPTSTLKDDEETYVGSYVVSQYERDIPVEIYMTSSTPLAMTSWGEAGDCNRKDDLSLDAVGIWSRELPDNVVELNARDHIGCVGKDSKESIKASTSLYLTVDSQHVSGGSPTLRLLSNDKQLTNVTASSDKAWSTYREWLTTSEDGKLSLFAYSIADGSTDTLNRYRNASVYRLEKVLFTAISVSDYTEPLKKGTLSITSRKGSEELLSDPNFENGLWSPIFNANASEPLTNEQAGLSGETKDGILTLRADKLASGISQELKGVAGSVLHLKAEARNLVGTEAPVVRLTDVDGTLIWQSELQIENREWQKIDVSVTIPTEHDNVFLNLYSFATEKNPSTKQYKGLSVKSWSPAQSDLLWVQKDDGVASLNSTWTRDGEGFIVDVAPKTRFLVLNQTYHGAWKPYVDGVALPWKHVRTNGFLNGWEVPADHPEKIELRFEPTTTFETLKSIAFTVIALSTLYMLSIFYRARGRRKLDSTLENEI